MGVPNSWNSLFQELLRRFPYYLYVGFQEASLRSFTETVLRLEFEKRTSKTHKGGFMKNLLVALSLLVSTHAFAQEFGVGTIAYGGTGCKTGTAELTAAGDGGLKLQFSEFNLKSGVGGRRLDRKTCSIALPIQAPEGFSMSLVVAPEGVFNLDSSGSLNLRQESFIAGERGLVTSKTFVGPDRDFFLADDFDFQGEPVWTSCGESSILRLNLSAIVRGRASAKVDALRLTVLVRPCQ